MCGIVGLFSKSPEIEESLGRHLAAMLTQMSDRGPDSAGVAVYRDPAPTGSSKLTLFSADPLQDWEALAAELGQAFGGSPSVSVRSSHAVLVVDAEAEEAEAWVRDRHPELRDPAGEDPFDVVLPQAETVRVARREVADVQSHGAVARHLGYLPFREESVHDAALVEHLEGARQQAPRPRAGELLARPAFVDGDVHSREGELAGQH